ncbi:MAG: putative Ig domain-containing protein, partial [Anaerolineaceae bacterium]|nr:putative Ig domain-containing protein [Anaerolineaceae bacterium]
SKDTWTWNPVPGQEFVYSVNVCNNGPTGSTELILTDTLPDAVTFVDSWGGYAGWEEVSLVEQTLTLMYPSIPGWSCRDVYMQVSLSPDAQVNDELINTAVISADNDDPDEEDNQTWLSHNVSEPYIDLSVDLNWHWGSLVPGGQYRYGIYFRNNGNMLVPGQIAVSTTLPTGTSFAGWDHWEWANIIGDPEVVGNTVTWQVGDLGAGYSGAIEVYVNIDAGVLPETELLHSAGIEVQVDEEDTENNSAGFSEIVRDHGPNLRISKWGDWHGDSRNAWYSLRVENIGDETVEDVLITDILPAEMELDGGIGVNYGEPFEVNTYEDYFTVTLDRLEPGWNPEINFNTRIPEEMPIELGTVFTNTASVSPTEYDIYVEDNSTSFDLTYTSGSRPYLHIDKWMTSGEPGVGGNATFHVQYINQGGAVATGVELTDVLVGMTYISDTSGITPTVNVSGSEIAWEIGDLEPGDWIGFEVFVEIDYALDELLQNTIEITTTSLYLDGDPSERSSYWEGNVLENATQLSIGKSPWTENPAPGETFIYQISVCNNGQTASSDVTLTETLPANTTFVNWIGTEPGWTETSQSGQTLELENPTISAGSCYGVYVEVLLDPEAQPGDLITNTATISSSSDLSQGDDTATYNHYVGEPYADLAIWANFNWGSLTPGGHYRSILQFRNQGNLGVTSSENIYVTATLPAGTSFAGWDKWDWGTVGEPTVTAETVSWLVTDLDPGAWSTIELWLDINSETAIGTELVNEVSITEKIGETYTENNYAIYAEFVWAHGPNPRIRKWGDWHSYGDGHNAWYHIQVENIGDQTVDGVLITDDLPTGMVLDGDVGVGFWEYSEVTDYGNYFTVFLDRLEPGWNVGMDFNVVIPGEDPVLWGQVFTNTATITEDPTETNPEDNSAEFVLGTGTDMFVEKTWLNGEILPGEQVEFLLEFGNKQPGHTPWWGMTGNAILVDTLPEGMSFVSSYWHCYQEEEWCELIPEQDGQTLTWSTWPLGPGVSHVMVLTVLIDEEIQEGNTLVNTFEISSDQPTVDIDPFMENNTSTYDPGVNFVAPTITSANSTTFTVGSLGSFTFTSSGSPTSQITYTGTLPVGVGFVDNGDGTAKLEGTPATGTEGVYELTITASNGVLPEDTQTFTLTVVPAPAAPIITSPAITNFKVGIPGSFTVTATGNPSPTFSYTGSLPDGVTLTSAGLLSGTAAEGTGGVYSLTITASNGVEPDDTQSFTLVVSEAPEFTSEDNTTFTAGMLGSFTITTSGYPKPAITTGDALPAWLSLVDQGDGTAILSGTPPDENGVDYILLNADNGVTPDAEQNFTLTWEKSSGLMLYLPLILK